MKYKKIIVMAFFSSLFGCDNTLTGPDFNVQESKVIDITDVYRVDYQMPGNMATEFGFSEKYKQQPKSITIKDYKNLEFENDYWYQSSSLDVGMWEYYRGSKRTEKNIAAELSVRISINKTDSNHTAELIDYINNAYEVFVKEANDKTRSYYPEHTDADLGDWLIKMPQIETRSLSSKNALTWATYGEVKGRHLKYIAVPIDSQYYLNIRFRYSYSAKDNNELEKLQAMLSNDIEKIVSSIIIKN